MTENLFFKMKIALIGYGKMGHAIEEIAVLRGHEIVCRIDADNQDAFESPTFAEVDVAIEFTTPATAVGNYLKSFEKGVPVVSGTTGWLDRMPEIERACEEGATFFYASNFSLGVNIFFAMNRWLASVMNKFENYDVALEEIHHVHKLDHPSGTAITIADDIVSELNRLARWRENENTPEVLPIISKREGEIPGTHIVRYDSDVDTITIEHRAKSRRGFALGAVVAAEFTVGKRGFLTMSDMLSFLKQK